MRRLFCSSPLAMLAILCVLLSGAPIAGADPVEAGAGRWTHGLSNDESYFPIAVWLQSPRNAARYKAAGINLYVGLWDGPNAEQLTALETAGMRVICAQNAFALANK